MLNIISNIPSNYQRSIIHYIILYQLFIYLSYALVFVQFDWNKVHGSNLFDDIATTRKFINMQLHNEGH